MRYHSISIHAPAWGATGFFKSFRIQKIIISIHAPAWGATCLLWPLLALYIYFNPRPRVGGDVIAPATGTVATVFQSTPPRGGRLIT